MSDEVSVHPREADMEVLRAAWLQHVTECDVCLTGCPCDLRSRLDTAIGANDMARADGEPAAS
ncbi:hypothetical protein GCM10022245_27130 [Streptomyces mayteni]